MRSNNYYRTTRRQVCRDATDWPSLRAQQKTRNNHLIISRLVEQITDLTVSLWIGLERSQQLRADRSGLLQSEIVGFGGWWLENLFSKTIIRQRQWFAIANNSHHADKSPETPPTDRASERNKKTRNNHLIISRLVAGGGLEPPTSGLWARQANQLLHPAMYLYSKWSSCVLLVQRYK